MATYNCNINHWHADYNRRVVRRQRLAISKIQRMKEKGLEPFEKKLPSTRGRKEKKTSSHQLNSGRGCKR